MNELTKEASKQTILEAISFLWLSGRGKQTKPRTEPYTPLQGRFRDYLTEIDVTYPCEVLPPDYQAHLDKPVPRGAIDIAAFKEWCEQLDKDMESGNPPF